MSPSPHRTAALQTLRRRYGRQRLLELWRLEVVKTRAGTEVLRNWWIDRRYGEGCGGTIQSRFRETGAYGTSSADYWQLRRIFSAENNLAITPSDVLVDVGCGKGRVLNHWLEVAPGNRLVGLELDPGFAAFARDRLADRPNVAVVTGDAIDNLPADATIIFLFNPFDDRVLTRFRDRVAELYPAGSPVRIVYYFCMHRHVFEEDPRFTAEPFARPAFHPGIVVRRAA